MSLWLYGKSAKPDTRNVFSDSSHTTKSSSFSIHNDTDDSPSYKTRATRQKTRRKPIKNTRLRSSKACTNCSVVLSDITENHLNKASHLAKSAIINKTNIPNFDSFDSYELVIVPKSPMRTRISTEISTPGNEFEIMRQKYEKEYWAELQDGCREDVFQADVPDTNRTKRLLDRLKVDSSTPEPVSRKLPRCERHDESLIDEALPSSLSLSIADSSSACKSDQNSNADNAQELLSASMCSLSLAEERDEANKSGVAELSFYQVVNSSSVELFSRSCMFEQILEEDEDENVSSAYSSAANVSELAQCAHIVSSSHGTNGSDSYSSVVSTSGLIQCTSPAIAQSSELSRSMALQQLQLLDSPCIATRAKEKRKNNLLKHCTNQSAVLSWTEFMNPEDLSRCKKIGEGVYGEVFRTPQDTVIKIVPTEGDCTVNDEPQKNCAEMQKELIITRELSNLNKNGNICCRNFVQLERALLVRGEYPEKLLTLWDEFADSKGSENDRPNYFSGDQLFIIFEFKDGGQNLESFEFESAAEGLSVLRQVGWALAMAEERLEFEHRDLHWGNILISRTEESVLEYRWLGGDTVQVPTSGIHATIIDFTLSRLCKGQTVIYLDLTDDETLFQGNGDYQFDIYREMKNTSSDNWKAFNGRSNVLWMKYLADKLLKMKQFPSKRTSSLSIAKLKKSLLAFMSRIDQYYSIVQMVCTDELFQEEPYNMLNLAA